MNIYRERLSALGFKSANNAFTFNAGDFVGQEMADIDSIVRKSTKTVDEGYDDRRSRTVRGAKKTNWFWNPSTWFTERYEEKTEYYTVHVPVNVDYVNMKNVVEEFFVPMQVDLISLEKDVPEHLSQEAKKLKENLKNELKKVDNLLNKKLQEVKERMDASNQTATQIAEQEKQLEWMRSIITRVNKLINY